MADPIDFNAFLAGDSTYQEALRAIDAARTADLTQRNAVNYQGLINYGEIPTTNAGTPQNVLDFINSIPQTVKDAAALATQSGYSQIGQGVQQYNDAQSLMRGNLGERNIIRSGDYAYLTNKNSRAQQLARANYLQQLLGGFNTNQQNYLSQLDALRGEQGTASQAAWQRMMDMINAKAAADAAAQQAADNKALLDALNKPPADTPGPNANPNNPTLVPDMTVPTPTNTPGLNIPAVDEQGYAIPNGPLYPDPTDIGGFHQGALPSTPFTPLDNGPWDPSGPNGENVLSMEPRTNIDTNAYGSQGVANPDPVYNTPTVPIIPGYGGDATSGQVDRNTTGYPEPDAYATPDVPFYSPPDYYAPEYNPQPDYSSYASPSPEPVPGYGGPAPAGAPAGSTSTYYQNQRNML